MMLFCTPNDAASMSFVQREATISGPPASRRF